MKVKEKYKLYLSWDKIKQGDGVIFLDEAKFHGPVLKEMMKLENNDFILLDLTKQFSKAFNSFFITKLSWSGVRYTNGRICLGDAILHSISVDKVIELLSTDYILINTEDHQEHNHEFNLTYPAVVCNSYGDRLEFE